MASLPVLTALASVLDGQAEVVPADIADELPDDLRLLALRAVFERHMRAKEFDGALVTAKALLAAEPDNAAHIIRKGKACFGMGEFETSRDALTEAVSRLGSEPRIRTAKMWLRRCQAELDAEAMAAPSSSTASAPQPAAAAAASSAASAAGGGPSPAEAPVVAPQGFIRKRFDWFQTMSEVCITLFAKGARQPLPEGVARVEQEGGGTQVLLVQLPHTPPHAAEEQTLALRMRLGGAVNGQPAVRAGKVNVELVLTKAAAVEWPDLQRADGPREAMAVGGTAVGFGLRGAAAVSVDADADAAAVSAAAVSKAEAEAASASAADAAARRAVPRHPQEWAAMEKELEEAAKDEVQPEGDEALQALFRQIYSKGSPETRRAMNKSFSQSGGRTLSTNWSEVAQAQYDKDGDS